MATGVKELFMNLEHWQQMLNRQQEVFSGMLEEVRIGILPKDELESQSGRVLVWEAQAGRMLANYKPFTGFRNANVDILFVADEQAQDTLHKNDAELSQMKDLIRRGSILLYVLKTKNELLDMGYEEFLDTLGLAYLGACR